MEGGDFGAQRRQSLDVIVALEVGAQLVFVGKYQCFFFFDQLRGNLSDPFVPKQSRLVVANQQLFERYQCPLPLRESHERGGAGQHSRPDRTTFDNVGRSGGRGITTEKITQRL